MWFNYVTYDLMLNPTKRSVYCEDGRYDDFGNPHTRQCVVADCILSVDTDESGCAITIEDCRGREIETHSACNEWTDMRRAFLEGLNMLHRLLDHRFVVAVEMDLPKRDHEQLTLI
jgi:hypothetical protein